MLDSDLETIRSLSSLADPGDTAGLVILYGLPGSGKTYMARLIAERCRAVALNSDQARRALVQGTPRYDAGENRRVFNVLNRRTEELLDAGQRVVFDSTAVRTWIRAPLERIAFERGIDPVRVHLDPPEEVIRARLDDRTPAPDPVDQIRTWWDVYEWMKPGWQTIVEPHLCLVDPESAQEAVGTICRLLRGQADNPT